MTIVKLFVSGITVGLLEFEIVLEMGRSQEYGWWFFLEDEIREEESKSFILSSGPVEIENCIRGYSDEMLDEKLVIKDVDTVKARFSEVWWDLQLGFRAQLGTLSNSSFLL